MPVVGVVLQPVSKGQAQGLNSGVQVLCRAPGFIWVPLISLQCVECKQRHDALHSNMALGLSNPRTAGQT